MKHKITSVIVRLSAAEVNTLVDVARMTGLTKSGAVRYALATTLKGLQVVQAEHDRALHKGNSNGNR